MTTPLRHLISLLVCLMACTIPLSAQNAKIEVTARIDSTSLFIGEQATLTIEATQPADVELNFPVLSDNIIDKLELVETLTPDTTTLDNGYIHVANSFKITAFDSALIYMPGFKIAYLEDTLITNGLSLKVYDMPVDTTQQSITDIKDVYKPPFDWLRLLTIIAIVILAAALIALIVYTIYRFVKKSKAGGEEEEEYVDPRTPQEIAIEALNELKVKELWQKGRNKEYQSELTTIVREYINRCFGINATELSTEEILHYFRTDSTMRNRKTEYQLIDNILRLADLVKFAKMSPLGSDNERAMKDSLQFIELTTPEEQPTEKAAKTTTSETDKAEKTTIQPDNN